MNNLQTKKIKAMDFISSICIDKQQQIDKLLFKRAQVMKKTHKSELHLKFE